MIREVHVFDIDGTIVDSTHRYQVVNPEAAPEERHIDLEHWRANQHKATGDSLLPLAALYRRLCQDSSVYVVIATARNLNAPDWQFLTETLGIPNKVISRKIGDNQSGVALKSRPLRSLKALKQFRNAVWHFWEDNLDQLHQVCDNVGMVPHFIPSAQGY